MASMTIPSTRPSSHPASVIKRLLIANRGEIACRINQSARRLGIRTIAVFSDADAGARHVALADETIHIGGSAASESYLDAEKILQVAVDLNADAIHPGYGFLSENPAFVEAVEGAGLIFVGPSAAAIRAMGLKDAAKQRMSDAGVPVVPGYHGADQDPETLSREAAAIGYPVMIKARAGGGGKGMRVVEAAADFSAALSSVIREADNAFADSAVLIEKYIASPRHIEVQVFGDQYGEVVHLFERDCSLQRRHQKVIEEAPAPGMSAEVRAAMTEAAIAAAKAIDYSGAGTVEFIADGSGELTVDGFWFMEMNTRLQVEHPVTEAVTGQDLVEWQLRVSAGEPLPRRQSELTLNGHAFEARLYAEDPQQGFLPAAGSLQSLRFGDARIDTGVRAGDTVTPYYDPMIAKLITHAADRGAALASLADALAHTHVGGLVSNRAFLSALAESAEFRRGGVSTGLIEENLDSLLAEPAPSHVAKLYAAIVLLELEAAPVFAGFRIWGQASHKLDMLMDGKPVSLRLGMLPDQEYALFPGDATATSLPEAHTASCVARLKKDASGGYCDHTGRRVLCQSSTWREAGSVCAAITVDGRQHQLRLPDALQGKSTPQDRASTIAAPMTGTVRVVDVAAGQPVSAGERLLVIEAMKMETSLQAPRDGVIEVVLCEVGDAVEGGRVLVRLEEEAT